MLIRVHRSTTFLLPHAPGLIDGFQNPLTVGPSSVPQRVPEWIKQTSGFQLGAVEVVAVPPTLEEVRAAGYSEVAAASIVDRENERFEKGQPPYAEAEPAVEEAASSLATEDPPSESAPKVTVNILPTQRAARAPKAAKTQD